MSGYDVEVRAEPTLRTRPDERSVHRELSRLTELIDLVESGMVSLVDAESRLEDRLAPILSPASPSVANTASPDRDPANCVVAEIVSSQCRRLEHLIGMLNGAERFLRDTADRVEV